jgi:hypothetical protein
MDQVKVNSNESLSQENEKQYSKDSIVSQSEEKIFIGKKTKVFTVTKFKNGVVKRRLKEIYKGKK